MYWALAEGAETTGITLHRAVAKVDSGPILAQSALAVHPDDTSGTLTRRLVATGLELLPGALTALLTDVPGVIPDMSKSSYRGSVGHRPVQTAATAVEAEPSAAVYSRAARRVGPRSVTAGRESSCARYGNRSRR